MTNRRPSRCCQAHRSAPPGWARSLWLGATVALVGLYALPAAGQRLPAALAAPADGVDLEARNTPFQSTTERLHPSSALVAAPRLGSRLPNGAARISAGRAGQPASRSFFVRDLFAAESSWYTVDADLLAVADGVVLWVERAEADALRQQGLFEQASDSLAYYLAVATPPSSADPSHGVVRLVRDLFGEPTDVDGDGRVHVLLLDIPDQFETTGSYVAGFFDPTNLTDHAASNRAEIVYLDASPTLVYRGEMNARRAAATVAHELQHLTLERTMGAEREPLFINEGLSELAEILCGFEPRRPDAFFQAPDRSLLSWMPASPLPDYARASLFFDFLFGQGRRGSVAEFAADPAVGEPALERAVRRAGWASLDDAFAEWVGALVEGRGYRHVARAGLRIPPARIVDDAPTLLTARLPARALLPLAFPLTRHLQADYSEGLALAGAAVYPGGRVDLLGANLEATRAPYGGLSIVAYRRSDGPDGPVPVAVRVDAEPSGRAVTLAYDDGIPDSFGSGATHLLLGLGSSLVLPFSAADADGRAPERVLPLSARIRTAYLSEIEGSGVPITALRVIVAELWSFRSGRPAEQLAAPVQVTSVRDVGRLGFDEARFSPSASWTGHDSLAVVVRSGSDNLVAVALDRNSAAGAGFSRGVDADWLPLAQVWVAGSPLVGLAPMIQLDVAAPTQETLGLPPTLGAQVEGDSVRVTAYAAVPLGDGQARCTARTPTGRLVLGRALPLSAGESARAFMLPLETSGAEPYHLTAALIGADGAPLPVSRLEWTPTASVALALKGVAPNPASGPVRILFALRQHADVSLSVIDALGRTVATMTSVPLPSGAHELPLDLAGLASGTYRVVLTAHAADGQTTRESAPVVRVRTAIH